MTTATLKGLLGRKLRTGLTALAIVLGVAMVCGSFVLTDTMLKASKQLKTASYSGSDAVVTGRTAFSSDNNAGASVRAIVSAGGPTKGRTSASDGAGRPRAPRVSAQHRAMLGRESTRQPSRSNSSAPRSGFIRELNRTAPRGLI